MKLIGGLALLCALGGFVRILTSDRHEWMFEPSRSGDYLAWNILASLGLLLLGGALYRIGARRAELREIWREAEHMERRRLEAIERRKLEEHRKALEDATEAARRRLQVLRPSEDASPDTTRPRDLRLPRRPPE